MASESEFDLNQAASESEQDEQQAPEETETQEGESESEDIEQVRSERDAYKRDYAALKKDYDKNAAQAKKSKSSPSEDQDMVITWMSLNSDSLKMVAKEYQEELQFYKNHNIPVTNEIRDRALREAKNRKGLIKAKSNEAERQAATAEPTQGEHRATKPKVTLTEQQRELGLTEEMIAKYKDEVEPKRKA